MHEHGSETFSYEDIKSSRSDAKPIKKLTDADKILSRALENKLEITEQRGGVHIAAKQYVGVVHFDGFSVHVRPKIAFENPATLPRMIEFAYGGVEDSVAEMEFVSNGDALREMLVRSIVKKTETLFRRGIHRSYVVYRSHTEYMRGRLLFDSVHLRDIAVGETRPWCEFSDISYDNPENRLLKAGLEVCWRITAELDMKRRISILLSHMDGIVSGSSRMSAQRIGRHYLLTQANFIDPTLLPNASIITYNRMNRHYEPIHRLCKLLLDSTGLSDIYGRRIYDVGQFFVDMDRVFEIFVAELFKKYYSHSVKSQKSIVAWNTPVSAILDIWMEDEGVVLDTKYKVSNGNTPPLASSDLYQIGFYAYAYGKGNRAYAILPSVPKYNNKKDVIVSCPLKEDTEKLYIYTRYIDLDYMAELIYKKEADKITSKLMEMLA